MTERLTPFHHYHPLSNSLAYTQAALLETLSVPDIPVLLLLVRKLTTAITACGGQTEKKNETARQQKKK